MEILFSQALKLSVIDVIILFHSKGFSHFLQFLLQQLSKAGEDERTSATRKLD